MSTKTPSSRIDEAVPHPPTRQFSERQKQAIELSGEAEHADGKKREELTRKAEDLGDEDSGT